MGGNTKIINKNNLEFSAASVPLEFVGRQEFINTTNQLLFKLNDSFNNQFQDRLWEDETLISDAIIFNGSTSYVMNQAYLDKDILPYKKTIGDIDVMIDRHKGDRLYCMLEELEGKYVTPSAKYLGCNAKSSDKLGNTLITIWQLTFGRSEYNVQIDFELADFENGRPTEWAQFSHMSSIIDLQAGFKGVFQKHLLRSMVGVKSSRKDVIMLTKTSTSNNYKLKKMNDPFVRMMQFGVDTGVGENFVQVLNEDGKAFKINGKVPFKEKEPSTKIYNKDLNYLTEILFGKKGKLDSLYSFIDIIEAGKGLRKNQKIDASDRFFDILFGISTQIQPIVPDSWKEDTEMKLNAYYKIIKSWDIPAREGLSDIINMYVKKAFFKEELKAIEEARKRIQSKIMNDGIKIDNLHVADTALSTEELRTAFDKAFVVQGILEKDRDAIFKHLSQLGTPVDDKLDFLKLVRWNKISSMIIRMTGITKGVYSLHDLVHPLIKKTQTYQAFYDFLKNYKLNGQAGKGATGVGRAEAFLMFFGKDAGFADIGDVKIEDDLIEVKFGHANLGYSGKIVDNPNEKIKEIVRTHGKYDLLDHDYIDKDKNAFNFKKGNAFEKLFALDEVDVYCARTIIEDCFTLVFEEGLVFTGNITQYTDDMLEADGSLAPRDLIYLNLAEFIFEKYQENEKFSYMMCLSSDGEKVVNIRSYEDFSKYNFKFDNFSWGGKMQQTVACTLKGAK